MSTAAMGAEVTHDGSDSQNPKSKKPKGNLFHAKADGVRVLCHFAQLSLDSAFKQQRLPAWQPILTAGTVLPTFFVIGVAFIPIGIGMLWFSDNVITPLPSLIIHS